MLSIEMPAHQEHLRGEVFPPAHKMGLCVREEAKPLNVAHCRAWQAVCFLGAGWSSVYLDLPCA